uniref:CARD domain-containing protein n=1 Tax=Branchiostoma floridae TaxID=7739 RepID=C3Y578_BRAFL|eukprot:XP_002608601.1 hypothetical protein BRAFLDRAFT_96127 [Branchiostoma floridae]
MLSESYRYKFLRKLTGPPEETKSSDNTHGGKGTDEKIKMKQVKDIVEDAQTNKRARPPTSLAKMYRSEGLMEECLRRVVSLEADVTNLRQENASLKADLLSQQQEKEELREKVTDMQKEMKVLKQTVETTQREQQFDSENVQQRLYCLESHAQGLIALEAGSANPRIVCLDTRTGTLNRRASTSAIVTTGTSSETGPDNPTDKAMTYEHRKKLASQQLKKDLQLGIVLPALEEANIITTEMKERIDSHTSKMEKVEEFLNILKTRGDKAFEICLNALKEDPGSAHLVKELEVSNV